MAMTKEEFREAMLAEQERKKKQLKKLGDWEYNSYLYESISRRIGREWRRRRT